MRKFMVAAAVAYLACLQGSVVAQERSIIVASTTSTKDSGLFAHLLPRFKDKTGIAVRVIAQGTGQALDTARRGDADVVLVHARQAEEKFIEEGFGLRRQDVMYNDFVLIGPAADPARTSGSRDIVAALRTLDAKAALFVSRGDRSGTHQAELALWREAALDPAASKPGWYREIGQGMGAALNTAKAMGAYVLSDRGTWISFKGKEGLVIAVEGDSRLFNQYGVMVVNPAKHPHVKTKDAQAFADYLISPEGQADIAAYRIEGQQVFFSNAAPTR